MKTNIQLQPTAVSHQTVELFFASTQTGSWFHWSDGGTQTHTGQWTPVLPVTGRAESMH